MSKRITLDIPDQGKVTADMDFLNYIALAMGETAYRQRQMGLYTIAQEAQNTRDYIVSELERRHFYDDLPSRQEVTA